MLGSRGLRFAAAFTLALTVAASACGGDDEGSSGDDDEGSSSEEADEFGRTDGRDPTPMEEFWSSVGEEGGQSEEASEEEYREQQRRVEEAVAACMADEGFEYTPVEYDDGMVTAPEAEGGDDPWSLPPDEFAERYGYGMFTIDYEEAEESFEDPNAENTEGMSEAERLAYDEALYGTFDEETGETTDDGGCQGRAWSDEGGGAVEDEFSELMDAESALWERIDDDPRVADAAADWADCMADAGYPDMESPDEDPYNLVQARYDELAPEAPTTDDTSEEGLAEMEEMSANPGEALAEDDLRDLRAYEIEVATADRQCRDEYDDVRYDVQVELEQEFLDENREELERYREAAATSGVG